MLALVMPTMASVCEMRYLWHTPYALANDRLLALDWRRSRAPRLPRRCAPPWRDLDLLARVPSDEPAGDAGVALRGSLKCSDAISCASPVAA